MLNWGLVDDVADKFFGVDPDKNTKSKSGIADNGLEPGKNYTGNKNKTKAEIDEEERAMKELQQRIVTMMRRLPTYLFLEETKVENVHDILQANNEELFEDTVGIPLSAFKDLCSNFIKTDRLDRAIMAYNQIESM
jgi:uncharacterized protein YeeX (DUF496 family)